ncbi:elicitin [Phytophthora sojae]|uniref:Elicitin n=2 Tax=Phytophthora sojae TaxID=67593 RepID=G4YX16_PHYSP|nr:elicitin [Phytophthora sojae]ABB56018.1 elicitin-like protein SOL1A [Phytophthora sojae]EGZ25023.1 elicitin [Phytophthora sojae]|eukprot:XP_009520311.1 elicitin [Phytophthora sojae]
MKFAAFAATAATLVAVSNAAACDVTSLQTLLTSSDTTTCASDSGYTVTSLATPTDAEMKIMCTSTACQSVLNQLETLAPSECTLGAFALYADLITPLTNYCSGASSTVGSSATTATAGSSASTTATVGSAAGSSTSATVTTSSTGSAASTPATSSTSSTTSSGSSTSQTASSSSAASAAASASASSSASMAAVSAGAVVAAVVATFF